ncbi:AF4/FMR2 family member lilli-like [Ptychodera flava]|uniref:AF4/FMR2 family member lilli-like n=1 Tax=Ptychodera flava TaxID=63121 RepID=UPI00396A9CDD
MRDSIVHMPDETNATKSSDSITNNSLSSSAFDTINEVPPTTQIATISSQSVQMSTNTLTSVGHLSNVAAVRSTADTGSMSTASVRDGSAVQKQGAVSDVTLYTHQGTSVAASASLQSTSPMQSNYLASNQSAVSSASNIQTSVYSQPQTRHSSPAATFAVPSVSNPSPSSNTTVPSNSPSFESGAVSSQVHTHQTSHQLPGVGIPSPSSNNTNVPPRNQPSLAHLNVYATHSRAGDTRTTHSMYTTESAVTPIYTASQSQQNAMVSKSAAQTPVLPFPQIFHRPGSDAANQLHRSSSLSSSSSLSTATITSGSLTPNAVVSAGQLSPVLVSRQPACAPTQYVPSNPLNQSSQALMRQPSPKNTTIPSPGTVSQRHAVSQPSHLNVAPPLFSVTESTTVALSRSLPVMTNQPMAAAASQRSQPVSHQLPRVAATTATVSTRASQGAVTHSRQTSGTTAQHHTGTKPQATQPATSQGVSNQFSTTSTAPSTQRNTSEPPTTHSQETAKGQRSRKKNSNTSYSVQSLSQSTVASRPPTTSLTESSPSQFSAASAAVTPTTSSSTSKEPTVTSPQSHVPHSSPHWSHKPPVQSYSSSTNFNFAVPSSVPAASAPHSMASNSNQDTSASPFYLSTSAGQHSLWKPPPQHMHGRSQVQLQTPFSSDDPSTMRTPDASQIDTLPGQIHGGQSNTGSVPFTSYINQPGMIRGKEQQQHIQQHHQHQQQHQQHHQQQHQQQRQVRPQQFENSPLPCVSEVHTSVSGGQSSRPVAAQRPSPQQQRDQHSNKQQKQPQQPSQQQQSVQHQQQHPPAQRQHQQQQQQQQQQRQQQHHQQQQQQRQHQQQRQQQQQQTQQQTAQQQRQHLTHQRPQQQHIPQQQTAHTVATHQPPQQPQTMQSMQSQVSQADKQRESTNQRQQRNSSNREPMARNQDKVPHSQYQRTPQQGQFSPSSSQSSMSMSQFNPNLHFTQRSPLDGSGASLQQSGSNTSVSNQNQQPSGRQSKSQAQKRQHPSDSQQNKGSKRMTTASNRSQGSQQSVRQEYRSHSSDMSRNSSNAPRTSPASQPQSIGRQLRGNHIDSESRTTQPVGLDTAVWPAFPQRNANPNIGPDLNNAPFLGFGNAPQHSSYNISSSQPTTSSTSMDNTGNFLPSFSPPRHLSGPDMPTYFPPPLPNHILTSPPQPPKPNIGRDAEISAPFNPMFTSSRPSGIGMNFQPNFPVFQEHQPGFNIGKTSSGIAPPITSNVTVTPHVSNFNVSNIFPEITGAGTSSQTENIGMNISSLRLPVHGNPTINLDPGVTSLHNMGNKPPPPPPPPAGQPFSNSAMSINNLLGPSHGAEDRPSMRLGLNSTLSTPFHSSTFNSGIPPLNLP